VSPEGKEARTVFTNLRYLGDTDESIVKAEPLTGRTHQIRVHLQHLGHPIANDPLYNHAIWGKRRADRGSPSLKEVAEQLLAETQFDEMPSDGTVVDSGSLCPECEAPKADPTQLCIYLHAFRYA
jgi:23S rRNA-/tRNA-specific pseudouridylate synthase